MDIKRRVFANLSRFRDCIGSIPHSFTRRREYQVLLDLDSGEMHFSKKLISLDFERKSLSKLKNPKQIILRITDKENGVSHFAIAESDPLDPEGVVKETVDVLNEMATKIQAVALDRFPEVTVLENLSQIHAQIWKREVERLPEWRENVSLEEVENELLLKPPGSYLILPARDVSLMIEQMKVSFGYDIHPYLIVFRVGENKLNEALVLGIPKGWIFYGDEPNIGAYQVYGDFLDLIKAIVKEE